MRKILTALFFGISLLSGIALAQADTPSRVTLKHDPFKAGELPEPGEMVVLEVRLHQIRSTSPTVQAIISYDGQFMSVANHNGYLNEYDEPTYEIAVPAPRSELSYRFIVSDNGKVIAKSRTYAVRRECVPDVGFIDLSEELRSDAKDYGPRLIQRAKRLEKELNAYETAENVLEQLENLLDQK